MKMRSLLLGICALLALSCGEESTTVNGPSAGVITKIIPVLLQPADMACVPATSELTWTGYPRFTEYEVRIYEGISDTKNPLLALSTHDTTAQINALPIGPSYAWKVGGRIDNDTVWSQLRYFAIMAPMAQWTRCTLKFDAMVVAGIATHSVSLDGKIISSSTQEVSRVLSGTIDFLRTPSRENVFRGAIRKEILSETIGSEGYSLEVEFDKDQKLKAVDYTSYIQGNRYYHGNSFPYSSSIGFVGSVLDVSGSYNNVYRIEDAAVLKSNFLPCLHSSERYSSSGYVHSQTIEYKGFELRPRPYIILEFR